MTTPTEELLATLANITKALAYADNVSDRVKLTRIAKTFIARHEKALGCEEWIGDAAIKAYEFERADHRIPLYGPPS